MAGERMIPESDHTRLLAEAAVNARASQRESDYAAFQDEYCKHDDCLIGVIRALAAIRANVSPEDADHQLTRQATERERPKS